MCVYTFTAAVFTKAKMWPEPQVSSLEEWVSKGWFTQWNITHPWKRGNSDPCYMEHEWILSTLCLMKLVQPQCIVCDPWIGCLKSKSQQWEQNGGSRDEKRGHGSYYSIIITQCFSFTTKTSHKDGPWWSLHDIVTWLCRHCDPTWHHQTVHLQWLTWWVLLFILSWKCAAGSGEAHLCSSTREAEAKRSWIQSQLGKHSQTLYQKKISSGWERNSVVQHLPGMHRIWVLCMKSNEKQSQSKRNLDSYI